MGESKRICVVLAVATSMAIACADFDGTVSWMASRARVRDERVVPLRWRSAVNVVALASVGRDRFFLPRWRAVLRRTGLDETAMPTIEDPSGVAMAGFYRALEQTEHGGKGALTRVLHMGDSSIGLDGLPHALRTRMQTRFGDGGAGFVLLHRYSANYQTRAARLESRLWTTCYLPYLCDKSGHYGLGGHVFTSKRGARTKISTKREGLGATASRFEVWYAVAPWGGELRLSVDGGPPRIIRTQANMLDDRWHVLEVEPGPHVFELAVASRRPVRAYGVVMETPGPGVVWDTVSMIGAFTKRLRAFQRDHIARQIARRNPDLLVLNYGGNDLRRLVSGSADAQTYKSEYRDVLDALRAGRPSMACLIVSVIDHGRSGQRTVRPHHVEAMVTAQREVAFETGCAFFDSVSAMGGTGSIRRWRKHRPPLAAPDLKHLNARGRQKMAALMYEALMTGFETERVTIDTWLPVLRPR